MIIFCCYVFNYFLLSTDIIQLAAPHSVLLEVVFILIVKAPAGSSSLCKKALLQFLTAPPFRGVSASRNVSVSQSL